jgi:hypothetical protein
VWHDTVAEQPQRRGASQAEPAHPVRWQAHEPFHERRSEHRPARPSGLGRGGRGPAEPVLPALDCLPVVAPGRSPARLRRPVWVGAARGGRGHRCGGCGGGDRGSSRREGEVAVGAALAWGALDAVAGAWGGQQPGRPGAAGRGRPGQRQDDLGQRRPEPETGAPARRTGVAAAGGGQQPDGVGARPAGVAGLSGGRRSRWRVGRGGGG